MSPDDLTRTIELVQRAQAGDRDALNRLVTRYYERIRRIVRVRLSPALRARVQSCDIVQEVFKHAISRFDQFEMRNEASLVGWLAQVAEWKIKDQFHRDHAGHPEEPLPGPEAEARHPAAPGATPVETSASREEQTRLEQCLDALPAEYKELIVLRNFVGHTWEAVAQATGRPSANAARMMYQTAWVKLCKRMHAAGAPPPR